MYEQFSIDSKMIRPNLSILKNFEDKNSRINSFSIKGSMIENPVGDIDIVEKKNHFHTKAREVSNSNTLRFNQNINNSSIINNEDSNNKMNLSHIKISSNNITQSLISNPQFNSKSNLSISPSPSMTMDSNKIVLNNQHNPNYKKGMFSYPKLTNTPIIVQSNLNKNFTHEKPSFLSVLSRGPEREKDKSTINSLSHIQNSINIGKDDAMSQGSNSSKFDMNKFKIHNKNDMKTVENTINNKSNFELASGKQTINSGLRSPIVQTIENNNNSISYNNKSQQINNLIPALNNSNVNIIPKRNNFSKYLINESSQKENRNNIDFNLSQNKITNQLDNSFNNVNLSEKKYSILPVDQMMEKTQQSFNNQKDSMNNFSANSHYEINMNTNYKNLVSNQIINDTQHTKNENDGKNWNNNINLQYPHQLENRRMTLELVKIILKTNPSNNNNPITVLNELNISTELLSAPNKGSYKLINKTSDYKSSIFPPKTIQEVQQISSSLEIKNNNFEINNYYGNYTKNNNEEDKKSTMISISKFINKTNITQTNPTFSLNENSEEKMKWLTNLITPRVMSMKHADKTIPFIFKLVPTDFCFTYGLEHYILEFENLSDKKEKGNIDLLKINHCTLKGETSFTIALDSGKEELEYYEIIPQDKITANMYVQSINYISQLIKCKFYAKTLK